LSWLGVDGAERLSLDWWWQTFLVMGLTTALWVTVALLTEPEPDAVLDSFYRRVRPLGSWRPVRRRTEAELRPASAYAVDAMSPGLLQS
jgi:solute:Na+ symporter, SSS family